MQEINAESKQGDRVENARVDCANNNVNEDALHRDANDMSLEVLERCLWLDELSEHNSYKTDRDDDESSSSSVYSEKEDKTNVEEEAN